LFYKDKKGLKMTGKTKHAKKEDQKMVLPSYKKVALVLQGGGALGSYQAGVYEGLLEAGVEPHWIAGISIGALNTAIIAGNAPENRVAALKGFWDMICRPPYLPPTVGIFGDLVANMDLLGRKWLNSFEAGRAIMEGQNGFFTPRMPLPIPLLHQYTPDKVSYYNTEALKATLERFADFDRINSREIRVSLGAVNVKTGNFAYFDNKDTILKPEHFMASGALPPGFPAIEIDGEYYWDGGLVSNTPLAEILRDNGHVDTLIFQVDLWKAKGNLPNNFLDITERTKDIQYSSRTRMVTDNMGEHHKNAMLFKELLKHIPEEVRKTDSWCKKAERMSKEGVVNIIQLIYKNKAYEGHSKDYEFSPITMTEHWQSGLEDMRNTFEHPEWFDLPTPEKGFTTHDIHRHE
jgi:NTE family protein